MGSGLRGSGGLTGVVTAGQDRAGRRGAASDCWRARWTTSPRGCSTARTQSRSPASPHVGKADQQHGKEHPDVGKRRQRDLLGGVRAPRPERSPLTVGHVEPLELLGRAPAAADRRRPIPAGESSPGANTESCRTASPPAVTTGMFGEVIAPSCQTRSPRGRRKRSSTSKMMNNNATT